MSTARLLLPLAVGSLWLVACQGGGSQATDAGADGGSELDGGSDAGTDGGADVGSGPSCGLPGVSQDPFCASCEEAHCCITLSACAVSADCVALDGCVRACTGSLCVHNCQAQYASAVWLWSGLAVCESNNCLGVCRASAGSCGGINLTTSQCDSCVKQHCCELATACGTNDSCDAFIYQCLDQNSCPDTSGTCGQACAAAYPDAGTDFDALQSCARSQCPTDCAGL